MFFNSLAFAQFFALVFTAAWLLTRRRWVPLVPWLGVAAYVLYAGPGFFTLVRSLGDGTLGRHLDPMLSLVASLIVSLGLCRAAARQDAAQPLTGGIAAAAIGANYLALARLTVRHTGLEPVTLGLRNMGLPVADVGPYAALLAVAGIVAGQRLLQTRNTRLYFILAASYVFYAYWDFRFLPLIWFSSSVDWLLGHAIARAQGRGARRAWLVATVMLNLGILALFKYSLFLVHATGLGPETFAKLVQAAPLGFLLQPLLEILGFYDPTSALQIVGISFFTFESMSYVIDVYRKELEPHRSYVEYLSFVAFFPHLVAGPIVRPKDLLPQLSQPARWSDEEAGEGVFLIVVGLFKKVVIADFLATGLVDNVFASPSGYTAIEAYVAIVGYGLQIYCDFSGYTDMAIGLALLLGVRMPLNFDAPYVAPDIIDFWRRWHISLSTWLRDYLYIPLGGNRHGKVRTYFNLFVTMLLGGLWHGAAWTFVLWGGLHGGALALTRATYEGRHQLREWLPRLTIGCGIAFLALFYVLLRSGGLERWPEMAAVAAVATVLVALGAMARVRAAAGPGGAVVRAVGVVATFHFVLFCWVFFRSPTMPRALAVIGQLGHGPYAGGLAAWWAIEATKLVLIGGLAVTAARLVGQRLAGSPRAVLRLGVWGLVLSTLVAGGQLPAWTLWPHDASVAPRVTASLLLVVEIGLLTHFLPDVDFRAMKRAFIRMPAPLQAGALLAASLMIREMAGAGVPFVYFQF